MPFPPEHTLTYYKDTCTSIHHPRTHTHTGDGRNAPHQSLYIQTNGVSRRSGLPPALHILSAPPTQQHTFIHFQEQLVLCGLTSVQEASHTLLHPSNPEDSYQRDANLTHGPTVLIRAACDKNSYSLPSPVFPFPPLSLCLSPFSLFPSPPQEQRSGEERSRSPQRWC